MKTLIVSNYYLPGIKGGGPVNSIKNIVERLNGQFDILTKSKDVGEKNKYQNVKLNKWNNHASSRVFYLDNLPFFRINKILKNGNYDTIYLNSLFSTLSIFIILLTIFRNSQIILAPRGELNSSALSMKK
ncbi:glycosyl transferase family 1, partial [Staphylococcus saprophyticus]